MIDAQLDFSKPTSLSVLLRRRSLVSEYRDLLMSGDPISFGDIDIETMGRRKDRILNIAQGLYAGDESIEFDSNLRVSEGDENGAFVSAWIWIPFEGTELDKDPLGE